MRSGRTGWGPTRPRWYCSTFSLSVLYFAGQVDYGAFVLVGIGAAIVVQSILGCTGTFLGCCGNRKVQQVQRERRD